MSGKFCPKEPAAALHKRSRVNTPGVAAGDRLRSKLFRRTQTLATAS
jgi:hypothetical protein